MHAPAGQNDGATKFKPELLSRSGEFVAWGLSVILLATWALIRLLDQTPFVGLPILAIFMVLAAAGISLGNWMDRRTTLSLFDDRVQFENGLRETSLRWNEIQQVQISPSGWGDKVRVIGPQTHFAFRTLGEVKLQDEVKGRMGFADGATILERILEKSKLEPVERSGSGYYYARK